MGCNLWAKFVVYKNKATIEKETASKEESPTLSPSKSDVV